jgi:hypothetical protein
MKAILGGKNAVLMCDAPWTLPFVMPFGWLPFGAPELLWLMLNLLIVVASAAGCIHCK